jgi:hypothetical protein
VVIGSHEVRVPELVTGGYEAIEVIATASVNEMSWKAIFNAKDVAIAIL